MLINVVTFPPLNTISKVASWLTRVFQKIFGLQGKADTDREMQLENAMKRCFFYSDKKTISIWISSYLKQFKNSVQWINTGKLLIEKSRIAALFFQKKESYITHYMISWPPWASRITNSPIITPWSYCRLQPYTPLPPPSALHLTTLPPPGFRYYHLQPYT